MNKTIKPVFDSSYYRILGEFIGRSSYQVSHTLLHFWLKCQEFSWKSFKFEAATHVKKVWHNWVFAVFFKEGGDVLRKLEFVGVTEAIPHP
ncbi:hypothetical protein AHAS_Ahas13G0355100 [Arachis hypogaea]